MKCRLPIFPTHCSKRSLYTPMNTGTMNKKALLVWFLGWLPRDQLKKFKEVDEGEEQE